MLCLASQPSLVALCGFICGHLLPSFIQSCYALPVFAVRSNFDCYNVPDRHTGLAGLKELSTHRAWNFVEVSNKLW